MAERQAADDFLVAVTYMVITMNCFITNESNQSACAHTSVAFRNHITHVLRRWKMLDLEAAD